MVTAIVIPEGYAWNLLIAVVISFHCFIVGSSIGALRKKFFTKQFFTSNFPEYKDNYPRGGYPDMGNGKFSQKLTLAQWTEFNNAQRAHYNYLEGLTLAIVLELVAGLFFPRYSALLGLVYLVGRIAYTFLYKTYGASNRFMGALTMDIALLAWFVMACYGCFQAGGGVDGLVALFSTSCC